MSEADSTMYLQVWLGPETTETQRAELTRASVAASDQELTLKSVDYSSAHASVVPEIQECLASNVVIDSTNGRVLTDDYNPVEFYDAENREAHRRKLAYSVRRLAEPVR